MPEGHTIHRIARDHTKWFAGQKLIVTSPQGRFEDEARKVSGKQLRTVSAHGKHLLYHWNRNLIGHIHLGLNGNFRLHNNPPPKPRGVVGKELYDLKNDLLENVNVTEDKNMAKTIAELASLLKQGWRQALPQ